MASNSSVEYEVCGGGTDDTVHILLVVLLVVVLVMSLLVNLVTRLVLRTTKLTSLPGTGVVRTVLLALVMLNYVQGCGDVMFAVVQAAKYQCWAMGEVTCDIWQGWAVSCRTWLAWLLAIAYVVNKYGRRNDGSTSSNDDVEPSLCRPSFAGRCVSTPKRRLALSIACALCCVTVSIAGYLGLGGDSYHYKDEAAWCVLGNNGTGYVVFYALTSYFLPLGVVVITRLLAWRGWCRKCKVGSTKKEIPMDTLGAGHSGHGNGADRRSSQQSDACATRRNSPIQVQPVSGDQGERPAVSSSPTRLSRNDINVSVGSPRGVNRLCRQRDSPDGAIPKDTHRIVVESPTPEDNKPLCCAQGLLNKFRRQALVVPLKTDHTTLDVQTDQDSLASPREPDLDKVRQRRNTGSLGSAGDGMHDMYLPNTTHRHSITGQVDTATALVTQLAQRNRQSFVENLPTVKKPKGLPKLDQELIKTWRSVQAEHCPTFRMTSEGGSDNMSFLAKAAQDPDVELQDVKTPSIPSESSSQEDLGKKDDMPPYPDESPAGFRRASTSHIHELIPEVAEDIRDNPEDIGGNAGTSDQETEQTNSEQCDQTEAHQELMNALNAGHDLHAEIQAQQDGNLSDESDVALSTERQSELFSGCNSPNRLDEVADEMDLARDEVSMASGAQLHSEGVQICSCCHGEDENDLHINLTVLLVIYTACWFPSYMACLMNAVTEVDPVLQGYADLLGYCNAIVNPFLCLMWCEQFRKYAKQVVFCRDD